ncbi:MAG: DMT family transporter [Planctomycetes bacterium]|nr:DMT family transporter [Planctomycetota bacterium]
MTPAATVNRARLCIVLAALLWSLGGLFTRVLSRDTFLGVNQPALSGLQIAFYRALFAGLVFIPLLRRRDLTYRPLMFLMVGCFSCMNALFITAMVLGSAANAILLQNSAPFWVYFFCVYALGEAHDRQMFKAILIGMAGVLVIILGGWVREGFGRVEITSMALLSALMYGGVILCLRELRDHSSMWLTTQNHLGSALCLGAAIAIIHGPVFWWDWTTTPTVRQLAFLAFFGSVQMALPYALFARGLKHVSPQEAGMITLLEPLLNPLWTYMIAPETDTPPITTWIGGLLIVGALAWRYWPWRRARVS